MHRFFAVRLDDVRAQLPEEEALHALRVLRMTPGDVCQAIMDGEIYDAVLEEAASPARVILRLGERLPSPEPSVRVTLYQGIPKGDKMDYIVQKCTEAGVFRVVPVKFSRCVAVWTDKDADRKRTRFQRIAAEAAKQSGRAVTPDIAPPVTVTELCRTISSHELTLVPWEEQKGNGIAANWNGQKDVAIVIGPEGGIAAEEIEQLQAAGGRPVTLGPRIFRTETAGLAALVSLLTITGDMS